MKACHDLPASGGKLVFKATVGRIRDRYWWPTTQGGVQFHCPGCEACERRKTPHRRLPLPKGHVPVKRPLFSEYQYISWSTKRISKIANMLFQSLTTWHALLLSHPFAPTEQPPLHEFLWIEYFWYLFGVPDIYVAFWPRYRVWKPTCPRVTNSFWLQGNPYHTISAAR